MQREATLNFFSKLAAVRLSEQKAAQAEAAAAAPVSVACCEEMEFSVETYEKDAEDEAAEDERRKWAEKEREGVEGFEGFDWGLIGV